MIKHKKILGIGLLAIIIFISANSFIKYNEEIEASISGSIGGINIGANTKFSKKEQAFLKNICLSKRKNGINISSEDARALGKPTNDIIISISSTTGLLSTKTYNYNLWIGAKTGYIQNNKESKIYRLNSDENKFFLDSYLKFHTKDEVESMIFKEY